MSEARTNCLEPSDSQRVVLDRRGWPFLATVGDDGITRLQYYMKDSNSWGPQGRDLDSEDLKYYKYRTLNDSEFLNADYSTRINLLLGRLHRFDSANSEHRHADHETN